jgi:hypothetical protein
MGGVVEPAQVAILCHGGAVEVPFIERATLLPVVKSPPAHSMLVGAFQSRDIVRSLRK